MAYDRTVPPALIGQDVGGTKSQRYFSFYWNDPIGVVLGAGYIENAEDLGMREGDSVIYKDTNRGEWCEYHLLVDYIDPESGAGSLAFPEMPPEMVPYSDEFDSDDPNTYLVLYQDGRMVRIPPNIYAPDGSLVATQEEAEAGTDNEKRMTPLRVAQALSAQMTAPGIGDVTGLTDALDGKLSAASNLSDLADADAALAALGIIKIARSAYDALDPVPAGVLYFIFED